MNLRAAALFVSEGFFLKINFKPPQKKPTMMPTVIARQIRKMVFILHILS